MDEKKEWDVLIHRNNTEKEFLEEFCTKLEVSDNEKKYFTSGIVAFCYYALKANELDAKAGFCCGCLLERDGLRNDSNDAGMLGLNIKPKESERLAVQYYKMSARGGYKLGQIALERCLEKEAEEKQELLLNIGSSERLQNDLDEIICEINKKELKSDEILREL
ncbi:MAG: hypothetical protein LBG48_06175 [Rickettsiales bacterium]|jgi:hypothetical protein|nr:hypothetical protein [Rickettsiales bacterium]